MTNLDSFDTQVAPLGLMRDAGALPGLPTPEELRDGLVQFLMTLTDDCVANEAAPFNLPELFFSITGTAPVSPGDRNGLVANTLDFQRIPAIGSGGRGSVGLPPLQRFLDLNPRSDAIVADTVGDACDICTIVANADQRDTDIDGFGNTCYADLDNNNLVNLTDFVIFRGEFGKTVTGLPPFTVTDHADLNGDNIINLTDFVLFRGMFGSPPGPSGL